MSLVIGLRAPFPQNRTENSISGIYVYFCCRLAGFNINFSFPRLEQSVTKRGWHITEEALELIGAGGLFGMVAAAGLGSVIWAFVALGVSFIASLFMWLVATVQRKKAS